MNPITTITYLHIYTHTQLLAHVSTLENQPQ